MEIKCNLCGQYGRVYSCKESLSNHNRLIHGIRIRKIRIDKNIHTCKYCNGNYKYRQSKWKHEQICRMRKANVQIPVPVPEPETTIRKNKIQKAKIPAAIKRFVWDMYIGECIGKSKCQCCKITDITQLTFHCGHVISEKNGGSVAVTNLRPICQNCNSSMGYTNMDTFIEMYKLHEARAT